MYIINEWYAYHQSMTHGLLICYQKKRLLGTEVALWNVLKTLQGSQKTWCFYLFFPEKCKAIRNSTSSPATVCSLHFIWWEWLYWTTFKTRYFKPLESFQIPWVLNRKGVSDWIICVSASILSHPHLGASASNTLSVVSSLVLYSFWPSEYRW